MLTRKKVIASIKEMPEKFQAEDLIERLILLQKIEDGIAQAKAGKVVSLKDAKGRLAKWLK